MSNPISETSKRPSDSGRDFGVKHLGSETSMWSLEAAKDVKKCKYKNPEKNQFCSLFQTILFLPINNSFKHIVWKRITAGRQCLGRELKEQSSCLSPGTWGSGHMPGVASLCVGVGVTLQLSNTLRKPRPSRGNRGVIEVKRNEGLGNPDLLVPVYTLFTPSKCLK